MPAVAPSWATSDRIVAGGQITTMARGFSPEMSMWARLANSSSEPRKPFIFQLPAISGEIVVVTVCYSYLLHRNGDCPNPGCQHGLLLPSRQCGKGPSL